MGKLKFRPLLHTLKRVGKHVFMPGKVALGTLSAVSKHAPYVLNKLLPGRTKREGYVPQDYNEDKTFSELGYTPLKDVGSINDKLKNTGYVMDHDLSTDEQKVFYNPHKKKVTISYRGTKPTSIKDLHSDWYIATGTEHKNKRFKDSDAHFQKVHSKYNGYEMTTTGHSLGGQISKYVNDKNRGKVHRNVAFSRGTGLFEMFKPKQRNTVDISNNNDLISLGARLQGGKHVIETTPKNFAQAHDLQSLYR